ncbi:MAG: phosphoribosylglycinamide formyltransferase [Gemmataceae bacterium]|nr:phosphoribosylglycinamide formyltransferase [Gemmataceae bacterium]MCS7271493.1 phosphoribosylglycinamide formyltransferase [Gemmataceae bacterium]MDW8241677.1 phosphoribosylglycinamide formyltransferase [Thermogemmata sp.]
MANTPLTRLAVLISGTGTTLQNLIEHIRSGNLAAQIVLVVSSRAEVLGVERARQAQLPLAIIERRGCSAADFARRVWDTIRAADPHLICMAGWLHLLPIPPEYRYRVLNIHPALLPAFGGKGMYGRRVHEAVLAAGVKVSGCTVHFADDSYDTGPIILQKCVPVLDNDTAETLAARVFAAECWAYPEAIRRVATGRFRLDGRRVLFSLDGETAQT